MLQGCAQSDLGPHQQVCMQVASGAAAKPAGQGCMLPAAGIGDTKCCTMLAGCGMLVKKQESRSTAVRKKRSRNLHETHHDQSKQCQCPLMLCTQYQCPLMLRTLMVTAAAARTRDSTLGSPGNGQLHLAEYETPRCAAQAVSGCTWSSMGQQNEHLGQWQLQHGQVWGSSVGLPDASHADEEMFSRHARTVTPETLTE